MIPLRLMGGGERLFRHREREKPRRQRGGVLAFLKPRDAICGIQVHGSRPRAPHQPFVCCGVGQRLRWQALPSGLKQTSRLDKLIPQTFGYVVRLYRLQGVAVSVCSAIPTETWL